MMAFDINEKGQITGEGSYLGKVVAYLMTPQPIGIALDIKPGDDLNNISLRSRGFISVAILTTDDFVASNVDPSSVEFGPGPAFIGDGGAHFDDVDFDGDPDLVLFFRIQDTGIECGDTSASLIGMTFDGHEIEGFDSIKTVRCD